MITTADALEIMAIVAACHHRTAPRMDDRDAVRATAAIWAELFGRQNLEQRDLVEAVKQRATTHADAPEPAEIIRYARSIRQDRLARTVGNDTAPAELHPAPPATIEARREAIARAAAQIGAAHDIDTRVTFAAAPSLPAVESRATIAAKVARIRAAGPPEPLPPDWGRDEGDAMRIADDTRNHADTCRCRYCTTEQAHA